jgi:uncharacterized membrane protein YqaE (UPF0057 family)
MTYIDKDKDMYPNNYISINGYSINCNLLPHSINTLEDIIEYNKNNNRYNFNFNNYYVINNGKIINKKTTLHNLLTSNHHSNIIYIDIIERQCGGGFSVLIDGIISIGKFFIMIYKVLKWLGLFFYWYLHFVLWLLTDFLKPNNFIREFGDTILLILISISKIPFDILLGLFGLSVNIVGGWMQGFWGWDQSSLTEADRNSNYFKKMNKLGGKKCYLTNTNTIPFSIIIGTILCPPIGVFMDLGMTGWLNIIICILLTLLLYVPGLVYALIIIYSA